MGSYGLKNPYCQPWWQSSLQQNLNFRIWRDLPTFKFVAREWEIKNKGLALWLGLTMLIQRSRFWILFFRNPCIRKIRNAVNLNNVCVRILWLQNKHDHLSCYHMDESICVDQLIPKNNFQVEISCCLKNIGAQMKIYYSYKKKRVFLNASTVDTTRYKIWCFLFATHTCGQNSNILSLVCIRYWIIPTTSGAKEIFFFICRDLTIECFAFSAPFAPLIATSTANTTEGEQRLEFIHHRFTYLWSEDAKQ